MQAFCSSIRTSPTNKESAKPRSGPRDIAWQHGVSIDNGKKSRCNYCDKVMNSGGATRLKQHLAGGFTNVESCPLCPPQLRTTMEKLLKRGEEYRLEKEREKCAFQLQLGRSPNGDQHVDDDEDNDVDVQRLQDASAALPLTAQSSYEVGGGSTRSAQSSQDDGGYTSSCALNIKSYYGSSKIVKPMHRVKKCPWTEEKDQTLISYIKQSGCGNWQALPALAGLRRSSKSCRLRWTNYLKPKIKIRDFTREEEATINTLYGSLGNKWSEIAKQLPGRTAKQVKDKWNTQFFYHTVELSTCEANVRRVPNHIPKTDLVNLQSDVSAMSGSDLGSVSDVGSVTDIGSISDMGSVSDMDENKGYRDTFKELPKYDMDNFSKPLDECSSDLPERTGEPKGSELPVSDPDTNFSNINYHGMDNFFKQLDECSSDLPEWTREPKCSELPISYPDTNFFSKIDDDTDDLFKVSDLLEWTGESL